MASGFRRAEYILTFQGYSGPFGKVWVHSGKVCTKLNEGISEFKIVYSTTDP